MGNTKRTKKHPGKEAKIADRVIVGVISSAVEALSLPSPFKYQSEGSAIGAFHFTITPTNTCHVNHRAAVQFMRPRHI